MKRWILVAGLLWAGPALSENISITGETDVGGEVEGSAEYKLSVDAESLLDCLQRAVEPSRFIPIPGKPPIFEGRKPLRRTMAEDCLKTWISIDEVQVESVDSCED